MTERTAAMLKNHSYILLLSFVFGFLVILPSLFSIFNIGIQNFKGVYPMFNDDEMHYLAMAKDINDGHFLLGNAFIFEHKNDDFLQPPLAEIIFAKVAEIFNISIPALFVVNDFVLPFLGVIALYFLFLNIIGSRRAAAIFSFLFYLLFIFSFGRPINPQFGFVFLVLGLLLIWKIYSNGKVSVKYNLLLGLVFGVLVYIYPYFWTALLVAYGLVLLAKIREWGIINSMKSFFIFALTAGVISVPYLINQYNVIKSSFYAETALRLGMLNIHLPGAYFNAGLLILALLALYLGKEYQFREVRPPDIAQFGEVGPPNILFRFCLVLLLSGLILNWQNVITGKYLQFSSHYYMVSVLFIFVFLIAIFSNVWPINFKSKKIIVFSLISLTIFSFICYRQSNEIKTQMALLSGVSKEVFLKQQGMVDVFEWFNKNSASDSVVLSLSNEYSSFLPIYTYNNLYSYGYAASYLMPDSEMEDRWVRQNIFNNNIDADYILAHQREIWLNKFIDRYQNEMARRKIIAKLTGKKITEPELVPQEYVDRVLEKYVEAKKGDLRTALKKYEINYLLLALDDSNYESLPPELEKHEFIEPMAKINNILIYKVR